MALYAEVIGEEVMVYADHEGVEDLIARLEMLKRTDHVHLMSEEWGLSDLSNHLKNTEGRTVHHIKIHLRPSGDFSN